MASPPVPSVGETRGGKNIRIELRAAEGRYDRLPELAQSLVQDKVDVIVAFGTKAMLAATCAPRAPSSIRSWAIPWRPQFELVINAKTAKALSIRIPESILYRAD